MASGNPFVASDVDGIREVTKGYGVLFPHGNDKALAEVIQKLCTDREYREEVVSKCRERALQYDISKNHLQYIPTQVITEYFRYMFRDDKGLPIEMD